MLVVDVKFKYADNKQKKTGLFDREKEILQFDKYFNYFFFFFYIYTYNDQNKNARVRLFL